MRSDFSLNSTVCTSVLPIQTSTYSIRDCGDPSWRDLFWRMNLTREVGAKAGSGKVFAVIGRSEKRHSYGI